MLTHELTNSMEVEIMISHKIRNVYYYKRENKQKGTDAGLHLHLSKLLFPPKLYAFLLSCLMHSQFHPFICLQRDYKTMFCFISKPSSLL